VFLERFGSDTMKERREPSQPILARLGLRVYIYSPKYNRLRPGVYNFRSKSQSSSTIFSSTIIRSPNSTVTCIPDGSTVSTTHVLLHVIAMPYFR